MAAVQEIDRSQSFRRRHERGFVVLSFGLGGLAVVGVGNLLLVPSHHSHQATSVSGSPFERKFVGPDDGCLKHTAYSPARGAHLSESYIGDETILTDTAASSVSVNPSALHFTVWNDEGVERFIGSDAPTLAVLIDKHCPDQPDGM